MLAKRQEMVADRENVVSFSGATKKDMMVKERHEPENNNSNAGCEGTQTRMKKGKI